MLKRYSLAGILFFCVAALSGCYFASLNPIIPSSAKINILDEYSAGSVFVQDANDPQRWNPATDISVYLFPELLKRRERERQEYYRKREIERFAPSADLKKSQLNATKFRIESVSSDYLLGEARFSFAEGDARRNDYFVQARVLEKVDSGYEYVYVYGSAMLASGNRLFLSFPNPENMPDYLKEQFGCVEKDFGMDCSKLKSFEDYKRAISNMPSNYNTYVQLR